MRVLVTGAGGAVGSYFCEWMAQSHSTDTLFRHDRSKATMGKRDLADASDARATVEEAQPDLVFHFASNAHVSRCFEDPVSFVENNVMSTVALYDAIRTRAPKARVLLASTPEVYGTLKGHGTTPVEETHPLTPANSYAASKAAQEMVALAYWQSYGLETVITRAFTYINPRRRDLFSTSFARQLIGVERGECDSVRHGNLESIRTMVDVRDLCQAYWLAVTKGVPGEAYNLGGTQPVAVWEVLQRLGKLTRIVPKLVCDAKRLRPVDVAYQVPNTTKFWNLTGWEPFFTLDQSLTWLLNEVRANWTVL